MTAALVAAALVAAALVAAAAAAAQRYIVTKGASELMALKEYLDPSFH